MSELTIPNIMPKVYSDAASARVDPNVMQFIMACAQVSMSKKILEAIKETNPVATGVVEFNGLDVTADEYREVHMPDTLLGLSVFNAGPDSVKIWINSKKAA